MLYHSPGGWTEEDTRRSIEHVRKLSGMDYLITLHGDATYSIPSGDEMMDFVVKLADQAAEM